MEKNRKTGLGRSLLVRRTEVPSVRPADLAPAPIPEHISVAEEISPPVISPEPSPVPPIQSDRKPTKKSLVLHDRSTLYLRKEINKRLSLAVGILGPDRSEIANDILGKHLPTYRIEIEGPVDG